MQKKKIICIFLCIFFITVSITSITTAINDKQTRNDWLEQDKLIASDGAEDDFFGLSASIDGDYAIIGANGDDNGVYSGSAYIFKRDGTAWYQQFKLLASDGAAHDYFGFSVSIDGDYAIIGAPQDDDNGVNSGSAYVFIRQIPDLDCSGNLDWTDVTPGETVTSTITVENIGDLDSLLDWEIESYPTWGTWSFDPENGTELLSGDSVIIDVVVVAPNEEDQIFTGEVFLVNSENPDDTCIIDVSLATPVIQVQGYQQIPGFMQSIIERFPILKQLLELF